MILPAYIIIYLWVSIDINVFVSIYLVDNKCAQFVICAFHVYECIYEQVGVIV